MDRAKVIKEKVFNEVKSVTKEKGYPPTVRELSKALNIPSTSTVHRYLSALEKEGRIVRNPSKPRAISILEIGEDKRDEGLLGRVKAMYLKWERELTSKQAEIDLLLNEGTDVSSKELVALKSQIYQLGKVLDEFVILLQEG